MVWKTYKMSDKEYAEIVERVRERNRKAALNQFDAALRPWHNTPTSHIAQLTGLSPNTVLKYKRGKWGKRGPMFTTYLAFIRGRQ